MLFTLVIAPGPCKRARKWPNMRRRWTVRPQLAKQRPPKRRSSNPTIVLELVPPTRTSLHSPIHARTFARIRCDASDGQENASQTHATRSSSDGSARIDSRGQFWTYHNPSHPATCLSTAGGPMQGQATGNGPALGGILGNVGAKLGALDMQQRAASVVSLPTRGCSQPISTTISMHHLTPASWRVLVRDQAELPAHADADRELGSRRTTQMLCPPSLALNTPT